MPTEKMEDLAVPEIHLKKLQSSDFYVEGKAKKWINKHIHWL